MSPFHENIELPIVVELDDHTPIRLRLGTSDDRDELAAGFARLTPESRIGRFFTGMPRLSELFLDHLVDVDESRHVAIVAQDMSRMSDVDGQSKGLGVGVARYIVSNTDETRAELAVAVIDEYHGRGIGHLLLDALIDHLHRDLLSKELNHPASLGKAPKLVIFSESSSEDRSWE